MDATPPSRSELTRFPVGSIAVRAKALPLAMTELVHPTSRERRLAFLEKRNLVDQKRCAVEDVLPARRIGSGIRRERKRLRIPNLSDLTVAVPNAVANSRPLIPSGEREKKNESSRTLASRKHNGCVFGRVQRVVAVVFESMPA